LGIYIQKIVGGYFASANPPHIQGDWRTPDAYSRDEIIDALLRRGAHQTDIGDAFYAADQEWLGRGGEKAAGSSSALWVYDLIIVIMGDLQLFTENTVTAVLPLATHPTLRNVLRLLRLWSAVFAANMAGTLLVAFLASHLAIVSAEQFGAMLALSRHALAKDA